MIRRAGSQPILARMAGRGADGGRGLRADRLERPAANGGRWRQPPTAGCPGHGWPGTAAGMDDPPEQGRDKGGFGGEKTFPPKPAGRTPADPCRMLRSAATTTNAAGTMPA